jgi:uncharacterized protein (DUF983 family)
MSEVSNGPRDKWLAMGRGFKGRCPNCGEGRLYSSFLRVEPRCPSCGEELHHQRADDAPPYFTILIVGHVIGAAMLAVEEWNDALPMWIHMILWPSLVLVMCLALLPRIKGALIGWQWALRMHGFGGESDALAEPAQ